MSLLTDKELEEDIRKDYDLFRIAEQDNQMVDVLIWTREAQHAKTLKAVAEWGCERCEEHHTANILRKECETCMFTLWRDYLCNGKMPGGTD